MKSFLSLSVLLAAVLCTGADWSAGGETAVFAAGGRSRIVTYPTVPTARVSTDYSLTVGTTPVTVARFKDIHYAHFSFAGQADIRVSVNGPVSQWSLSPKRYEIPGRTQGEDLLFSISDPKKLVVQINGLDRLFIFADPLEDNPPQTGDPGVVNILDFGVDNTGGTKETVRIQTAIDATPQNGVLFFPAGVYLSGTLELKSNMTLYLAGGSLIQGSGNLDDYPKHENDGPMSSARLILVDEAENVTIRGRGIVDSNGAELRNQDDHRGRVLLVRNSRNVVVEDVILRDPPSWNFHILGCEHVTVRNVKILNDPSLPNTDGFDPDASSHVLIEDCFAYCSDDSSAVKCVGYDGIYRDVEDIVIRGNVFLTKKSALKVGTESRTAVMKDITFEDNDVLMADRGMTLYCRDGATYSNIRYINNRFENFYPDIKQRLLDFHIRDRDGKGHIRDVLIRDCRADVHWPQMSTICGYDSAHIVSNVRFENFTVGGKLCRNAEDANLDIQNYVADVTFAGNMITR